MTRIRPKDQTPLVMVFAVTTLVLYYFSSGVASNILNVIGVLTLAATSLFVLKSKCGWVFFLYAFGLTFALVSGTLIELTGAFLIEIQETVYLTGAAARNAFLASFFLVTTYAAYSFFWKLIPARLPTIKTAEPFTTWLLLVVGFAAPLCIALVLITHGSPLFMEMDRFSYFTYIAPPGYVWLFGNVPLLGFVIALSAYKGDIRNRTSFIWLALTVIIYIMAGEKFSKILLLGFFFFLPFFLINNPVIKTRHMALAAMAVLVMAALVILNYRLTYGSAEMFIPRLALQGQMNYALDMLSSSMHSVEVIAKHFVGIGAQEQDRGLIYLMYLVAPISKVDHMVAHGATFTAPFPANMNYFFGNYVVPLAIVPLSIMAGGASALMSRAVRASNTLLCVVAAKIFVLVYSSIIMGNPYLLFGAKAMVMFVLLLMYFVSLRMHDFERQSLS